MNRHSLNPVSLLFVGLISAIVFISAGFAPFWSTRAYPITPPSTPPATNPITPPNTPTPTPKLSAPVILTHKLPASRVNRFYSAAIKGYSLNRQDHLTFTVSGLPQNLSMSCTQTTARSKLNFACTISGSPTTPANSTVIFQTSGLNGQIASASYHLSISGK